MRDGFAWGTRLAASALVYVAFISAIASWAGAEEPAADEAFDPSETSTPTDASTTPEAAPTVDPSTRKFDADRPLAQAWVVIPGGIADAAGETAYVASLGDGLEAIDMSNGHRLWEVDTARRPLAIDGERIVAEAPRRRTPPNSFSLLLVDAENGQPVVESQPIILPEWIAVEGGLGLTFSYSAAIEGRELVLTWQAAREFVVAGPKPTPEMIAATRRNATGTARVDLDTGRTKVAVDPSPRHIKAARSLPFYDAGDKRLSLSESTETASGGVKIIRRTLEAADKQTGRPLWRHEIAGEILIPANLPPAQGNAGNRPAPNALRNPPPGGVPAAGRSVPARPAQR